MQAPATSVRQGEIVSYVFTTEAKPWRNSLQEYARLNRRHATQAEHRLWQALRDAQLGAKFRRQHAIGSYLVDFICVKALLTIELDGEVHNEAGQAEYDRGRTHTLAELGYRELRFSNSQVLHHLPQVLATIQESLSTTPSTESSGSPSPRERGPGVR